ncbi:MAG TPA: class I SAM-dependent methyltransferase [Gemmatimonadota bacterium]|nr:class I SAM-dependent methyltransferase [Gemmatimonadota bacterium]
MSAFTEQRERIVPRARGRVLELGIGSGKNLALYDPDRVELVWGVDPSPELYRMAAARAAELPFPVRFFVRPADEPGLALADDSVDTVVVTYTLCTIPDPVAALEEARRTLAPEGQLLFAEHGRSPDPAVNRWQVRVTPLWRRVAGGCHLDRDPLAILAAGGFRVQEIEAGYLPGWKPAAWHYFGTAIPE